VGGRRTVASDHATFDDDDSATGERKRHRRTPDANEAVWR
jgi:hypothetical protein